MKLKILKVFAVLLVIYVGIVVTFESLIGYYQPTNEGTLVIITTGEDGIAKERVLSRLKSNDQLYVAANHWPRAWYNQVLENPIVEVVLDEEKGSFLAVSVTDEEHERVKSENELGLVVRFLTGFPPRYFVRLDPRN